MRFALTLPLKWRCSAMLGAIAIGISAREAMSRRRHCDRKQPQQKAEDSAGFGNRKDGNWGGKGHLPTGLSKCATA